MSISLLSSEALARLVVEACRAVAAADADPALQQVRAHYLGKQGVMTGYLQGLRDIDPAQRQQVGQMLNGAKSTILEACDQRQKALQQRAVEAMLGAEAVDITLPARHQPAGSLHLITQAIIDICNIFQKLGCIVVGYHDGEGPNIEDSWYNFTALNMPLSHPARQAHDTFYVQPPASSGGRATNGALSAEGVPFEDCWLLRTHTSPIQLRAMRRHAPPYRVVSPGRVYRRDSDATHTPMFHQVEVMMIDQGLHMGHLKSCLHHFLQAFFEQEDLPIRLRPHYFPFTSPSAEVDIGCTRTADRVQIGGGGADWLEILGCGMVHPDVLKHAGVDATRYQGFAIGMGVERLVMLKHGLTDLRALFENDMRYVQHIGLSPWEGYSILGRRGW